MVQKARIEGPFVERPNIPNVQPVVHIPPDQNCFGSRIDPIVTTPMAHMGSPVAQVSPANYQGFAMAQNIPTMGMIPQGYAEEGLIGYGNNMLGSQIMGSNMLGNTGYLQGNVYGIQ